MEDVSRMKITDYAILFLTLLFSWTSVYGLYDKAAFQNAKTCEELNQILDNVTTEALQNGYVGDKGKTPVINQNQIVDSFITNLSLMLYGIDGEQEQAKIWENIVCMIMIQGEEYYLCKNGEISEPFLLTGMEHEEKVRALEQVILQEMKECKYKITFPANSGEKNSQTISDYAVLTVYVTNRYSFAGEEYAGCVLSGAAIKEKRNGT